MKLLSCVRLLATPWTAAYQAPLPMGFSRLEYWSGVPLPSLTDEIGTPKKTFTLVMGEAVSNTKGESNIEAAYTFQFCLSPA